MAVVRLSRLEDLLSIGQLVQALGAGGTLPAAKVSGGASSPGSGLKLANSTNGAAATGDALKKNSLMGLADSSGTGQNGHVASEERPTLTLSEETLSEVWSRFLAILTSSSPFLAKNLESTLTPAIFGPNSLAIRFATGYNSSYEACNTEPNIAKMQEALRRVTGQPGVVRLEMTVGTTAPSGSRAANTTPAPNAAAERKKQLMGLPLFKKAADVLGAQIWHMDNEFNPAAPPPVPASETDNDTDTDTEPATDPEEM